MGVLINQIIPAIPLLSQSGNNYSQQYKSPKHLAPRLDKKSNLTVYDPIITYIDHTEIFGEVILHPISLLMNLNLVLVSFTS